MNSCIDADSGHSTFFKGLTGHLCTKPLSTTMPAPQSNTMAEEEILELVRKTFYISGYTLLYLIAMSAAAGLGRLAAYVAEKIVSLFIGERMKMYRDIVQVSQDLCVLICATGYLIVAVGLLFMHLVGGLPHEYDMLAVQIGIAFFGELVFVTLFLATLFVGLCVWAVWSKCRGLLREKVVDEEAGLMKNGRSRAYGTSEASERRESNAAPVASITPSQNTYRQKRTTPGPKRVDPAGIKMKVLSSVRNLDVPWMGGNS